MTETLKTQLEKLGNRLPIVKSAHFVLLMRGKARDGHDASAFLLERRMPNGQEPSFHLQSAVKPEYQFRLSVDRKKKFDRRASRTRFRFNFRKPNTDFDLPSGAQCRKGARLIKLTDALYERLRAHDSAAWELMLGDLLDIPSRRDSMLGVGTT